MRGRHGQKGTSFLLARQKNEACGERAPKTHVSACCAVWKLFLDVNLLSIQEKFFNHVTVRLFFLARSPFFDFIFSLPPITLSSSSSLMASATSTAITTPAREESDRNLICIPWISSSLLTRLTGFPLLEDFEVVTAYTFANRINSRAFTYHDSEGEMEVHPSLELRIVLKRLIRGKQTASTMESYRVVAESLERCLKSPDFKTLQTHRIHPALSKAVALRLPGGQDSSERDIQTHLLRCFRHTLFGLLTILREISLPFVANERPSQDRKHTRDQIKFAWQEQQLIAKPNHNHIALPDMRILVASYPGGEEHYAQVLEAREARKNVVKERRRAALMPKD